MLALGPERKPLGRPPRPRPFADASTEQVSWGPRGHGTILLVEDDSLVRRQLSKLVELLGYRVIEAASAEEALDLVERSDEEIHLLLSDVFMPGLDGFELALRVREARPGVRAMLMTGFADEAIRKGIVADLLVKPFTAQDLADSLHRVLM